MILSRRKFLGAAGTTVVAGGAWLASGCSNEKSSVLENDSTKVNIAVVKKKAGDFLLTRLNQDPVGQEERVWERFLLKSSFALGMAGRAGEIQLPVGTLDSFLSSPIQAEGKQNLLDQVDKRIYVDLARGKSSQWVDTHTSILSEVADEAGFVRNNTANLFALVLNQRLAKVGERVDIGLTEKLQDRLRTRESAEGLGWSHLDVLGPMDSSFDLIPSSDNTAMAVLSEVAPRSKADLGRTGPGWTLHIGPGRLGIPNLESTLWASWAKGGMSPQTLDFVLSLQKEDGGFVTEAVADLVNLNATAEALAFFAAESNKVFGRFLNTQKTFLGV